MRLYSTKDEEVIRTSNLLRDWQQSHFVGKDQAGNLAADLQTDLKRTNLFFRAVLFLFTATFVSASLWLITFLFAIDENTTDAILYMAGAVLCFALADLLARRYRLYRFGVEEALAIASVVLISVGVAVLAADAFRYQALVGLSIGAVSSLLVYLRFGYVYAGVASMLCAALIPFTFDTSIDAERIAAAAILGCVFVFLRPKRLQWGEDFPGDDYGMLQAAAWAAVYVSLNFQFAELDYAHNSLYWFTYIMIWVLPAAGLYMGLQKKDRPLMGVSIAMALATLVTNKPYLGFTRKPWDPILFGLLLMSIAIVVKRWLTAGPDGQRHGFTPARLLAGDKRIMTVIATASSVMQPNIPPSSTAPAAPQPQFGGGRSGGAGASGEF
jgi:hypothetical protein